MNVVWKGWFVCGRVFVDVRGSMDDTSPPSFGLESFMTLPWPFSKHIYGAASLELETLMPEEASMKP